MIENANVSAPVLRSDLQGEIENAQRTAEMAILRSRYDTMAADLDVIFTRIARGEQVELRYADGTVVPITRARRRGSEGQSNDGTF